MKYIQHSQKVKCKIRQIAFHILSITLAIIVLTPRIVLHAIALESNNTDGIHAIDHPSKYRKNKPIAPKQVIQKVDSPQYEDAGVCGISDAKTYEPGNIDWNPDSNQFVLMSTLKPDGRGFYMSDDSHIAVALGDYYGPIGSKFKVTLDTGITFNVIKADVKASDDVTNGCSHKSDGSILEFIIHTEMATAYYGMGTNGYINNGNYNNVSEFTGVIIKMERQV